MTIEEFNKTIRQVEDLARAGAEINPETFHPPVRQRKGKSRDLPMQDQALRKAITDYLQVRLDKDPSLKPTDPLFISQKGGAYSPNTLQDHIALMIRRWAGIEKGSSHSGRRTLLTEIIQSDPSGLKAAQQIAGHINESTTLIYQELPEWSVGNALLRAGHTYKSS